MRQDGRGPALAILGVARLGRLVLPGAVRTITFVRDDDPEGSPSRAAMAKGIVLLLATGRRLFLTPLPLEVAGEGAAHLKDINDLLQHDRSKVSELLATAAPPLFGAHEDLTYAALEAASLLPALGYERAREAIKVMLGF